MSPYLHIILTGCLLLMTAFSPKCSHAKRTETQSQLVIAAIVEGLGKHPGASSGFRQIFQLAKYRVVAVCSGTLNEKEIVVDHLLVSGDELQSIHVGDKVYLSLGRSETIGWRFDEEGFRSPLDKVDVFYIGHKPELIPPAICKN